jgi:hypothetical protein
MLATNAPYSDSYPLARLFGGLFRQRIDASVVLCAASCLTPALLPAGDESAMNFEGLGFFFRHIYCFPQHSCKLGGSFAKNVASPSIAPERAASGWSYGLGLPRKGHNTSNRYYRVLMYIGLCTSDTLHKKPCRIRLVHANFRERRKGEVRRTPKFSGSRPVASRNSLLRFLAPFVATWGGDRGWSRSTRHDGGFIGDETPEIATANFGEFYFHALR